LSFEANSILACFDVREFRETAKDSCRMLTIVATWSARLPGIVSILNSQDDFPHTNFSKGVSFRHRVYIVSRS